MSMVKTQVYLTPEQRKTLAQEAKEQHISLSRLVRQMVDDRIQHLGAKARRRRLPSFIGIGASGITDGSVNHDKYIGDAIAKEHNIR